MRISTAVKLGLVAAVVAAPVQAQQRGRAAAAPAAPAAPAALAGRWEGTFTTDVTQKSGRLVLTLNGADESATGQLQLTPTGGKAVVPEGAVAAAPTKGRAAPAPTGLAVSAMKTSEDKVTGTVDGSYMDPGCNCSVVSTFEGELVGNTLVGTISARDSRTGQWNFTSFRATKGAAARR